MSYGGGASVTYNDVTTMVQAVAGATYFHGASDYEYGGHLEFVDNLDAVTSELLSADYDTLKIYFSWSIG